MLSINFFCISNQFLCNWWQHIATETNHSVSCIIHAQGRTKNPKISVLPPFPKFPPSNAGFAGGTLANVQCNLFCVTCYHRQIVIFCKGKLMSHVGIVYKYIVYMFQAFTQWYIYFRPIIEDTLLFIQHYSIVTLITLLSVLFY